MENKGVRNNVCEFCNKINFDLLKTPLTSDLPTLEEGQVIGRRNPNPISQHLSNDPKPTKLGTLDEICQRGQTCPLCLLIAQVLKDYEYQAPEFDPEGKKVYSAEISSYGVFHDLRDAQHWLRRLSIMVEYDGTKEDYDTYKAGGARRDVHYAFQACSSGPTVPQANEYSFTPLPDFDTMLFSGRRRPPLLDFTWVQRWMSICGEHVECKKHDLDSEEWYPQIRFIDVKKRCIVALGAGTHRYVALSYVWGGNQKLVLTSSNITKLSQPGALESTSLSQTIDDSILVTEKLNIDYLWVDALCIIQNDDDDKKAQITAMGIIYNHAFLTIVAADAPHADSGLHGLRPNSRSFRQDQAEIRPGLSLMRTVHPYIRKIDHYLEYTPWNHRGWTLQERVLSRRMLVFRNEQVYWVCREANFCEESYFENGLRFVRMHAQALEPTIKRNFRSFYETKDQPDKWVNYRQLVTRFTRRVFKYDGDAFDAFSAIFHGFASIWGEVFLWGIPRSHFEEGLLWNTFTGQRRREDLSTLSMTSKQVKVAFPSWSWMGWIGETDIVIDENRSDGELPEILCFVHAHQPSLSIVRAGNTRTPRTHGGKHTPVTLKDLELSNPQLFVKLNSIPEDQLIFFWTRSAKFHLRKNDGSLEYSVINADGKVIGSTGVSPGTASTEDPELEDEFIVVGSRRNDFSPPVLLVLQIEWKDNIAYRVNFGEIFEEDWLEAPYTSSLIPLPS